jgi:Cof subfamily protein (haloacid dehalogenase superfamily)
MDKVKMIVTDLDGTLLRSDKTVSPRTKAVLARCRENGVKIVYATGRGGSADKVAPPELFDGKIIMNGAVAKLDNKVVYNRLIPWGAARPILVACDARGIRICSEISGMHYTNFNPLDFWVWLFNYKLTDFSAHEMDAEKLYIPNPTDDEEAFIKGLLSDDLYYVKTSDGANGYLAQIMHKDATKAKAVAELARLWGIKREEVAAFGDELNDVDMLEYAGIAVAMGNALEEVKAIADFVCLGNDEDGVAEFIVSEGLI